MRRLLAWGLLLPLLGCVAAPERRQPRTGIDPPEGWTAARAEPLPPRDDWWREFGDAQLDALVATALEQNRDLRAAAARVDRAEAEARMAGADLKPQLSAGLNASRQKQNFIGLPIPGQEGGVLSTTYTRYGLSLDVSWEADLWGRLRAGARAALAELQATDADLGAARLSLAGQTAKAWFAVLHSRQQVELARRSAESFHDVAEEVRSRYEKGLRPSVELRLALSNLAGAEALLERRRDELDRATRQLEILLGRYPAGALLERHSAGPLPALPGPVPAGLPAELVSRRPDLFAAERRLAAADQRLVQARRSLYPRLTLTGSGGSASQELGDLLDGDFSVWSLAGGLLQPVFQGGRLRAGVDRADALEREALETYAGAALRAYAEVESALASERRLTERERHLAEAAAQLAAALRLAEDRYRLGVGDYLTVLTSQTNLLTAESQLLDVRRGVLENRVDLHLALGGGFELDPTDGRGETRSRSREAARQTKQEKEPAS